MPPSQLKALKASLRKEGIVGPERSKKEKKNGATNGANRERNVRNSAALQNIRDQFNPFEVKSHKKGDKFEVVSNKTMNGRIQKGVKARPGVTKGLGEENVCYASHPYAHTPVVANTDDPLIVETSNFTCGAPTAKQDWWNPGQTIWGEQP
jgi:hypothetical protein